MTNSRIVYFTLIIFSAFALTSASASDALDAEQSFERNVSVLVYFLNRDFLSYSGLF